MELIRGIFGIRGIVGKSLTESVVIRHIQAFSEIQSVGDILLARDSRTHGESFIHTAAETLSKCGRNVIVYGIIPTPTAQFLIEKNLIIYNLNQRYLSYGRSKKFKFC